jgi:hypothetical protein
MPHWYPSLPRRWIWRTNKWYFLVSTNEAPTIDK